MTPNSEPRCSIESGPYTLQCVSVCEIETNGLTSTSSYLIVDNVVYLTIADKSYPRKLAFSYLDELSKEFATSYGPKVETVRKPYAFVGFGALTLLHCGLAMAVTCAYVISILILYLRNRHIHVKNCPVIPGYTDSQRSRWLQSR